MIFLFVFVAVLCRIIIIRTRQRIYHLFFVHMPFFENRLSADDFERCRNHHTPRRTHSRLFCLRVAFVAVWMRTAAAAPAAAAVRGGGSLSSPLFSADEGHPAESPPYMEILLGSFALPRSICIICIVMMV